MHSVNTQISQDAAPSVYIGNDKQCTEKTQHLATWQSDFFCFISMTLCKNSFYNGVPWPSRRVK